MNLERLQHQIDILRGVADTAKLFDMGQWLDVNTHGCGMAACAFGYACLDPAFQAEGLRLEFAPRDRPVDGERIITIANVTDFKKIRRIPGCFDPVFGGYSSFEAAAEFYDITLNAALYLFDPDTYDIRESNITPEDVIERVNMVIERDGVITADDIVLRDDDEDDC